MNRAQKAARMGVAFATAVVDTLPPLAGTSHKRKRRAQVKAARKQAQKDKRKRGRK